ncbi:MAG: hypothetical protein JG780_2000, partial [Thermosipho sp. (in: Bacteria)]|nr:hypothetical protein [Thermosipho sp. (in: thermotogales)]
RLQGDQSASFVVDNHQSRHATGKQNPCFRLQFSAHGTRRVDENLLRLRYRQQKQPGVWDGGGNREK